MADLMQKISPRERFIVVAAVLVMLVLGAHALVVEPYQQRLAQLTEEIEQQRADLAWMQTAVMGLPVGDTGPTRAQIEGTLANFINQAVRSQGLSQQLSQISPIGSDEIRMRYNAVDFNRLVGFIARVNASGLEIKDLRISAVDNPGQVDSSLILVRR